MNKNFFAALASATMAFTASGSIAVFADDFVEENTPSINAGDLKPIPTKVVFNKENFGVLVDKTNVVFDFVDGSAYGVGDLKVDEEIDSAVLADVKAITFKDNKVEGEIKGLEYFTKLQTFVDGGAKKVTNKALDFSANTKLTMLNITKAADLEELTLPKADEEEYHLTTLSVTGAELPSLDLTKQGALQTLTLTNTQTTSLDLTESDTFKTLNLTNTKLTTLDISKQDELTTVAATGNLNLKDVVVKNGRKGDYEKYSSLNLSNNALETVNLDYTEIGTLILSGNHIGALDLSNTKANTATLGEQTFYVSEKAANVNLTEAFPTLKTRKVEVDAATKFDEDTGVLTLDNDGETTYKYEVSLKSKTAEMTVKITAANPMNRLYNPNSGEHFYTADIKEKEALVALGWQDEGYGWVAPTEAAGKAAKTNVYRLYNPNAGDHHYTMNENEVKTLVAYGWKDEGTGWYSADTAVNIASQAANGTFNNLPVYRQYNPYANGAGAHNYTTDKAESNYLVSLGWVYEGTAWTALK